MIFDTHAHYDDKAFDEDREELLSSMPLKGVGLILDPGCDVISSKTALALSEKYPYVYAAVGSHPEELGEDPHSALEEIQKLAAHKKCRAIGEIGLDYYWDVSRKEEQKEIFAAQLALACELDLPVIVHDREAHGDCFAIVCEYPYLRGVFHCYSGSAEMAKELLKRGWYLGFDGPITYKNNVKAMEVLSITPLDRIVLETDSPYLSPVPNRGKRNDSRNLQYIAEIVSREKGISVEEVAALTFENGKRLYDIG